ncbi:MAG: hypothetical protein P4L99_23465 [Chthoniobacter sp.]|nr:hypothetical protein [Chthoniobacter sp.]
MLAVAGIVIFGTYLSGYVFFRANHQIIHRSSVAGGTYSSHSVEGGDGIMAGAAINGVIAFVYTPLRYVEMGYWQFRQPLDSPLSEVERRRRAE